MHVFFLFRLIYKRSFIILCVLDVRDKVWNESMLDIKFWTRSPVACMVGTARRRRRFFKLKYLVSLLSPVMINRGAVHGDCNKEPISHINRSNTQDAWCITACLLNACSLIFVTSFVQWFVVVKELLILFITFGHVKNETFVPIRDTDISSLFIREFVFIYAFVRDQQPCKQVQ